MKIEFDPKKNASNLEKHGVSLALAPETNTLYYMAFAEKTEARRIISLRRATRREVTYYVENI